MTRVLSELLGAKEPGFRLGVRQLEQASGRPSTDIRLSSEIMQKTQEKLRELGLDPQDTTGQELYHALQERVKHDDATIRTLLGEQETAGETVSGVQHLVQSLDVPKQCFALKQTAVKKLLKKYPPKKAMKQLGYRSVESMLKHEPAAQLYAAAWIVETAAWHKNLRNNYKQLLPTDFETRKINIIAPKSKRWEALGKDYVANVKHNILCFKELGAVVLLPLSDESISGAALAMLLLALHNINDIRTTSTYLKLHQVRPDFGRIVSEISQGEVLTGANLAGQRLPWRLVQRYFSRNEQAFNPEIFEPHVQLEDLKWQPVENVLAKLHPAFEFWHNASQLGFLHEGEPVSLNLTDAALNFCNKLPYEQRIVHYFRDHLWHELMLRYMHQEALEQTVQEQLADELIDAKALA